MGFTLNYSEMILLDAEDLAEGGVKKAYDLLVPEIARYITPSVEVIELIDDDVASYGVRCGDTEYAIYPHSYGMMKAKAGGEQLMRFSL